MMFLNPILHPSILMERKMFDEIGFYDTSFSFAEDYELWFRAMHNHYKFGNVPEFLISMGMDLSPDSITRGPEWRKVRKRNLQVKNKALLHYGFFKPLDIFYYLLTPLYYFISPKITIRARKIINRN